MNYDIIKKLLRSPVAFHRPLAEAGGTACAGLFLSQLLYWTDRASHAEGWIYKTSKEWHTETFLSEDEQRGARRLLLKRRLIEEDYAYNHFHELDRRNQSKCFRINFDALYKCFCPVNSPESTVVDPVGNNPTGNGINPIAAGEIPNCNRRNSQLSTTESTPETTSPTTTFSTDEGGGGEIDELIQAAFWEAEKAGTKILRRGAWENKLRVRMELCVSPADLATLDNFRRSQQKQSVNKESLQDGTYISQRGCTFLINGNLVHITHPNGRAEGQPLGYLQHLVSKGLILSQLCG